MCRLLVHGLFHLLGYEHETEAGGNEMREREASARQSLEPWVRELTTRIRSDMTPPLPMIVLLAVLGLVGWGLTARSTRRARGRGHRPLACHCRASGHAGVRGVAHHVPRTRLADGGPNDLDRTLDSLRRGSLVDVGLHAG